MPGVGRGTIAYQILRLRFHHVEIETELNQRDFVMIGCMRTTMGGLLSHKTRVSARDCKKLSQERRRLAD